jgi:hypothetical protein
MTTNRTPIQRPTLTMITPRALDLYEAMGKLRCSCPTPKPPTVGPCPGCLQWYDLHERLHDELHCALWQWPCISRRSSKHAGDSCWNDEIAARMKMLDEAAKARRAALSRKARKDTNVEPVAGQ